MRPAERKTEPMYECFVCGVRRQEIEERECPHCGGRFRNIAKPRDL